MSKKAIKEDKIVELYQNGYSAKDICKECHVSTLYVRNVLRCAGFNTRTYRKISENNKDKILLLIKNGYSYNQIGNLLGCSFHLVREVVEGADMVGFAPKNHPPIELAVTEEQTSLDALKRLKELYLSGDYGLSRCADLAFASDADFLWFVYHLTPEEVELHENQLVTHIRNLHVCGRPPMAIAKSLDVSPSVVKKILSVK